MTTTIGAGSLAVVLLLACSPASAQSAADQIRQHVKDGQKVSITDDQGREFSGKIRAMTADMLTIDGRGQSADVPYDRIMRIDHPRDGLANGALMGLGLGAALAVAVIAKDEGRCEQESWFGCSEPRAGGYVAGAVLLGGIGAAVGAGIDALIRRDRAIYRRSGGPQATVITNLAPGVVGAAVAVAW